MDEPQLPGMLGSFNRFAVTGSYWWSSGWTLELRHRHDGDAYNCTNVVRLEGLSSEEAVQAMDDFFSTGQERFTWDSEADRCRPSSAD
jgi:hypothetical protein